MLSNKRTELTKEAQRDKSHDNALGIRDKITALLETLPGPQMDVS